MSYVKWFFWGLVVLLVGGFLHYTLPRNDVVRIVQTEVRRVEVPPGALFWASSEPSDRSTNTRDVKFISTVFENGRVRVFRNEDTGWGWPPYFKFDSADLQARASDRVSSETEPRWFVVTYYGMRSNLFSIYPNVLTTRPATGPDMGVIPWTRIIVIAGLAAMFLTCRWLLKRFWRNRVDPMVREMADAFDGDGDDDKSGGAKPFRTRRERLREWWVELFG